MTGKNRPMPDADSTTLEQSTTGGILETRNVGPAVLPDGQEQRQAADVEPPIDVFLEYPVVWLSPGAQEYRGDVRKALNRHWLVTQWDGSGRINLHDARRYDENRVFRYHGTRLNSEDVDVFEWEHRVLFICLAKEANGLDDPAARLKQLNFTHDKEFGLWLFQGADIVAEFPELRPKWFKTYGG